jgi:GTP-binding protein Era
VLNKVDAVSSAKVLAQLNALSQLGAAEYFPISAKSGEGIEQLIAELVKRAPDGPAMYPSEMVSETPQAEWVAELVREQLLAVTRDELPYSIATRVTEWEWPRVRCEIVVERESQKGMVIGKAGRVLKSVGIEVRKQMPDGAFLELFVVVDKDWQHRADRVEHLGY